MNEILAIALIALAAAMTWIGRSRGGEPVWFLKSWMVSQLYVMVALTSSVLGIALAFVD
jgi:hypothetical protein